MVPLTPEIAEIYGIHAGDGYLRTRERNKGEIDISGNIEEKEYYDEHVVPLFNKIFNLNLKGRYFSRGTYGFVCYLKKVREKFLEIGFPDGKKSLIVRVPKIILDSKDKKIYCKFLRGVFDTDGNISFRKRKVRRPYPTISLVTVSKHFSRDICYMLDFLRIKYFVNIYFPKLSNEHIRYSIIINGDERIKKWFKLIGSKNPVKLSRFIIWKELGINTANTNLQQRKDILSGK